MNRGIPWLLGMSLAFCTPAMALSVFDVIELTRNGYDEREIERLIEVTNARFFIDVDSLLALGEADVANEIVALMLERGAEPPEQLSEADQLIALREGGFSEQTIMLFVRHQNFCEPLADEDEHRLGQAGFSSAFLRNFDAQVEDCREGREAVALIEPLPEEAYEEAPAQVTRVYQTNTTVYPSTTTVRYPRTTYYPRYHYGIYDSYYYHDRITRLYPIVVYRDYSGHKHRRYGGHRYGKAGHSHTRVGHRHGRADNRHGRHGGRDLDRRRRDGDGRRGDRRGDRDRGDAPRRKDSDVRPRRPHPRSDPNPPILAGKKPTHSVTPPVGQPDQVRRGVQRRVADPVSTKPFVPSVKRTDRSARQRPQRSPSDLRRRIERPEPEPKAPVWTTTPRPRVSAPVRARTSEPRYRPPQRTQPSTRPSRIPSVASPPRTPRAAPPPRTPRAAPPPRTPRAAPPPRPPRAAPVPRPQPVVRPPRPTRRSIDNDQGDIQDN